jgi:hypothetical protein
MSHLEVLKVQMTLLDALRSDAALYWRWQRAARQAAQLLDLEHTVRRLCAQLKLPVGSLPDLDALKVTQSSVCFGHAPWKLSLVECAFP